MRYDVIVIGAGSAGSVLAARLSEDPHRSVLLLEAGPDYPNFEHLPDDLKLGNNVWLSAYGPHNWGYVATVTPPQTRLTIPRGKATGGSSAINGQVLYRGVPEDYDNWASWGNDEWSFAKVLPYFRNYRSLTAPFDHERMRKAIRLAVRLGADSAFKDLIIERITPTDADLASDGALDDWLMRNLGTAHHVSGTCKMGPASDPMAVVSQYERVHGLEGLWVADASIMPDCIRANTNATTIMIGERVADFIKEGR